MTRDEVLRLARECGVKPHNNENVGTCFTFTWDDLESFARKWADQSFVPKMLAWFTTPNPMLGGIEPLRMLDDDRGHKLAQLVRNAIEDEAAAIRARGQR